MLNGKNFIIGGFLFLSVIYAQETQVQNCLNFEEAKEFNSANFNLLKLKDSTLAELDFKMRYQSPFTYSPQKENILKESDFKNIRTQLDLKTIEPKDSVLIPLSIDALSNRVEKRIGKNPFYPIKNAMEEIFKKLGLNYNTPYKLFYTNTTWRTQFNLAIGIDKNTEVYKDFKIDDLDSTSLSWIKNDYLVTRQNAAILREEIEVLMSYWYPKYNTDILDPSPTWPESPTEFSEIKDQYCDPLIVIKGNPFGKIIYQLVMLQGFETKLKQSQLDKNLSTQKTMSTTAWINDSNYDQFLKRSQAAPIPTIAFEQWLEKNKSENTLIDKKQRLHLRRGLEYLLAKNLDKPDSSTTNANNALQALVQIKNHLKEKQVDFIIVPIPTKGEIYSEDLEGLGEFEHIEMAKFYLKLREQGVEVLDVYNDLKKATKADSKNDEELFQKDDTHLSWRGFMTVSNQITKRLIKQSWYGELPKRAKALSIVKDSTKRKGDLVEHLNLVEQEKRPTQNLRQNRFLEEGEPYTPKKGSPILLIGDSHTGVFEKTDGKAAGFASHLAFATQLDVDLITSWGGGPSVYERVYKHRLKELAGPVRQVVLILSARDFWNYPGEWFSIKE